MTRPILLVPGWQNSGPAHWQSLWEAAHPEAVRVQMTDWDFPRCADWVASLDDALAACAEAPVLVGHSVGCIAIVRWAAHHNRAVHGALLAAPADVDRPACPEALRNFSPVPMGPLPFPSHVVVAADDPYLSPDRARAFAAAWGSAFTELASGGHLNATAGHGPWPLGEALLAGLLV